MAVDLRETEGRVSRIMSRAGLSLQTTHRPVQVADEADRMVKDVSARLDLLEKRAAGENRRTDPPTDTGEKTPPDARDTKPDTGKPDSDAKPDGSKPDPDARDGKPDTGKPDADGRGEKPDADGRDEKPDRGQPDGRDGKPDADGRGEKPDADGRDEKPDRGQPDGRDGKPDADGRGEKPDADGRGEKPDADGREEKPDARPDGDGERDGKCDDTGARDDRPDQGKPDADQGRPDPDRGKPDVDQGAPDAERREPYPDIGEKPDARDQEKPDVGDRGTPEEDRSGARPEDDGRRDGVCDNRPGTEKPDVGEPRDGSSQNIADTQAKDHPDDIETTRPRVVEVDGVKVIQVPLDPPTARELESLLDNLDRAQPADMPTVGGPCDDGASRDAAPGEGRSVPENGRDGSPGERAPENGRDGSSGEGRGAGNGQNAPSRDGGTGLVVPPTPAPDGGATAVVSIDATLPGNGAAVTVDASPPDDGATAVVSVGAPLPDHGVTAVVVDASPDGDAVGVSVDAGATSRSAEGDPAVTAEELRALIENAAEGPPMERPGVEVLDWGPGADGPPGQIEPGGPRRSDDGRSA
ncbi:hypothetical protein OUY22_19200 [Nonomuraea sp. MCN248]|uniref:Uncharacterized protein n=1 Tax=Nonomuraea corallina TaxID=2989783 RepID=A0ABT4SED1_9ACTN|nr:hypothetical protein [Nonomuraea corallina]MDA0635551.1 hypothetical protein [Nonomuraea corallina]